MIKPFESYVTLIGLKGHPRLNVKTAKLDHSDLENYL